MQRNKKKARQIIFFVQATTPSLLQEVHKKGPCIDLKPTRHTRDLNIPAQMVPKQTGTEGP